MLEAPQQTSPPPVIRPHEQPSTKARWRKGPSTRGGAWPTLLLPKQRASPRASMAQPWLRPNANTAYCCMGLPLGELLQVSRAELLHAAPAGQVRVMRLLLSAATEDAGEVGIREGVPLRVPGERETLWERRGERLVVGEVRLGVAGGLVEPVEVLVAAAEAVALELVLAALRSSRLRMR